MISLKDRLKLLKDDLKAQPPSFVMTADLPYAIFRYDPDTPDESEWKMRKEIRTLSVRVEKSTLPHTF